ncbi:MAG: hypothetical protein IPK76_19630 [Lewinellaceae bacterium]|nr:hypothetical protein [Lewinellaceae bacterium]
MPDGIDRPGLQPAAITEAQAIADAGTVTDACGTVDVTAVADAPATNTAGCKWTQTWTVTATDACGNDATRQVTYTWTVDVDDPEFAACPTASIDLDCNQLAITEAQAIADAGTVTRCLRHGRRDGCCRRTGYQYSGLQMDTNMDGYCNRRLWQRCYLPGDVHLDGGC